MEKEVKGQQRTRHKTKEAICEVNPPVPAADAEHIRDELPGQTLPRFLIHKILSTANDYFKLLHSKQFVMQQTPKIQAMRTRNHMFSFLPWLPGISELDF